MCNFMSALSDGKGNVFFFKLEDIQKIEQENNNKNNYNWNSHSSIATYYKVQEDKLNKWEYDCEAKTLKLDGKLNTKENDSEYVQKAVEKYLADNNAIYVRKIFCKNSGYSNSGNCNSGDRNSGYRNSGYSNSGYSNSGYSNSGNCNSGNCNSGDRNSGYRNSGNWNSGNWNSGDRNSGYLNTTEPKLRIFNKETNVQRDNLVIPKYFYFDLNVWVPVSSMTDEEKKNIGWYKTTDGYLKKIEYKDAWKLSFEKASKEDVARTLKLPNFKYKLFEEITGITKKMITDKLRSKRGQNE
jgi:hypothetical protein